MGVFDNRLKEYLACPYPAWIPATARFTCEYLLKNSLIQRIEQGEFDLESEHYSSQQGQAEIAHSNAQLTSLFSCFKNRNFKPAWNEFQKLDADVTITPIWFCLAIYSSFSDTVKKPLTPKRAEKWKADMIAKLESARATADKMPQNFFGWTANFESALFHKKEVVSNEEERRLYFYPPTTVLAKLIYTLEATESNLAFFKNHIESENARRAYFIRSLTTAFMQKYGSPATGLVSEVVNIVFDSEIVDQKQINSITADLKANFSLGPIVRKRQVTRILIAFKKSIS